MNSDEFATRFFSIEKRLNLFADHSVAPFWWNAVRFEVWYNVFRWLTSNPIPPKPPYSLLRRALNFLARCLLWLRLQVCLKLFAYDVLVLRAPRQALGGHPTDLALDDLVALCPGRILVIDTFPHYYHRNTNVSKIAVLPRLKRMLPQR